MQPPVEWSSRWKFCLYLFLMLPFKKKKTLGAVKTIFRYTVLKQLQNAIYWKIEIEHCQGKEWIQGNHQKEKFLDINVCVWERKRERMSERARETTRCFSYFKSRSNSFKSHLMSLFPFLSLFRFAVTAQIKIIFMFILQKQHCESK